jgi:hypothetical protein
MAGLKRSVTEQNGGAACFSWKDVTSSSVIIVGIMSLQPWRSSRPAVEVEPPRVYVDPPPVIIERAPPVVVERAPVVMRPPFVEEDFFEPLPFVRDVWASILSVSPLASWLCLGSSPRVWASRLVEP